MSQFDIQMRAVANTLITTYGKAMSLVTNSASAYDTTTGDATTTSESVAVKGVVSNGQDFQFFNNSLIKTGGTFVLIAAQGINTAPSTADTLVIDDVVWTILEVEAIYGAEQIAYFQLKVES